MHSDFTRDKHCVFVFCFPLLTSLHVVLAGFGKIKTLGDQLEQIGCCLSRPRLEQHTHPHMHVRHTAKTVCRVWKPEGCAIQMRQRWMRADVNQIYKHWWQTGFRVTNVINVSVTDSFRSSYSEQGVDTDNYDSDKCQEYVLFNCYAALIDSAWTGVFDQ